MWSVHVFTWGMLSGQFVNMFVNTFSSQQQQQQPFSQDKALVSIPCACILVADLGFLIW